ncbi:MAG: hypothetical protein Q8M83_06650 [bacterium]|nr:hypothetical protein [bacterium]
MSNLRKLAHLEEQLGEDRFGVLISSDNTGKVKAFCDELLKDTLPSTITIAGRTYNILGFLKGKETSVVGHTMVERAKEMAAHLGEDDGKHILEHKNEIPVALRGKVAFVFTDWRHPDYPEDVAGVFWYGGRWVQLWYWLGNDWFGHRRVLCRK